MARDVQRGLEAREWRGAMTGKASFDSGAKKKLSANYTQLEKETENGDFKHKNNFFKF